MNLRFLLPLAFAATALSAPPEPKFVAVTLDDKLQLGYGVAVADVDGDRLPDVLVADKKQFVWYKNPGGESVRDPAAWKRYVLAENLTMNDNVCIAAKDIDGDGRCEIAVGAEWNPNDTVNSGAVFYLIPPADRRQKWEPVKFPSVEPTTHRMRWVQLSDQEWGLVVAPLHGRGNKNGEGAPAKVLLYHPPTPRDDPKGEWKSTVIDETMHMTHNFDASYGGSAGEWVFSLAGKEGVVVDIFQPDAAPEHQLKIGNDGGIKATNGAGEIRSGRLEFSSNFTATIEPMHGNALVAYMLHSDGLKRHVLTDKLTEGHALRCGDLLGTGADQIVVGWRGTPGKEGSTVGIHLWTPLDEEKGTWRDSAVDDGGMACEDLALADLDGDGKLDIVASGRATHNLKIYINDTRR